MNAKQPVLIIGYGNPARGDDALGPACVQLLEAARETDAVADCFATLTDYQLQVEMTLDLADVEEVIFVDAHQNLPEPCRLIPVTPARDQSFSSHALSPSALLAAYTLFYDRAPPRAYVLAIAGSHFTLGESMSPSAEVHLQHAFELLCAHLQRFAMSDSSRSGSFILSAACKA